MCRTHYSNILFASSVLLGCLDLSVDLAFLFKITCSYTYIVLCVHGRQTRTFMILENYSVDSLTSLRVGQAGYRLRFSARARDNVSLALFCIHSYDENSAKQSIKVGSFSPVFCFLYAHFISSSLVFVGKVIYCPYRH
jgi:hypothetical protein